MSKTGIFFILFFSLLLPPQEIEKRTLAFEGLERTFLVRLPLGYDETTPAPLVLAFHDLGGSAEQFMGYLLAFNQAADRDHVILVYPDGFSRGGPRSWNAYHCCGDAFAEQVNDVGFVRLLIEYLQSLHNIDQDRIFALGSSNGGMFSHRLAAELPDKFAALADMSGCIGGIPAPGAAVEMPTCPKERVSIMMVHGFRDPFVPFAENWQTSTRVRKDIPFRAGADFWKNGLRYTKNVSCTIGDEYEMQVFKPERELARRPRTLQTLVFFKYTHHLGPAHLPFALNLIWEFFQGNPRKLECDSGKDENRSRPDAEGK